MRIGDVLADQLNGTREWTLKLIADLRADDWSFQPGPGLAHARYLIGHLAVSQNLLIHVRCLGKAILDDEFAAHFPIGAPVRSVQEHAYPPVEKILTVMTSVHERTLAAVRGMGEDLLTEPAWGKDGTVHPHYRDKLGAVSHCERHEAFHAGQIATIRRLLGKSFLR
jgi:uncharacterized damage-inducible protein DinB